MQPFAEFRRWVHRASAGEKASTAVAVGAVLAVLGWVVIPASSASNADGFPAPANTLTNGAPAAPATHTGGTPVSGVAPGANGVAPPGAPVPAGGSGTVTAGTVTAGQGSTGGTTTGAGSTAPAGRPASCGPSSAPGVTATTVKVAITIAEIVGPAGNATFGLPTAAEQKQKYETVIAAVNSSGGVACRRVVPVYYSVNPADDSDMHAKCLDIAQAGTFAVIDDGGEYVGADCFGQHHIAYFGENLLFAHTASQYYPYLMTTYNLYDDAYRTAVLGLKQRGFFDRARGFRKLGFLYFNCHPEVVSEMTGWLHQAGLAASDIVGYDAGCPSPPLASPSDIQQAILKFKSSGVSHVTFAYFLGSLGSFTTAAQQQGFRPKYGLADDGYIGVSYGTSRPDRTNFDGAISITTSRYGEEHTPGYRPTAGTARCNQVFVKARMTPIYQQPAPSNGGAVCNLLWTFQAAADHAPVLAQNALAAGLAAAKSLDFSFPGGPNDYSTTHGVAGADAWRVAQYAGSCGCWKLADATFRPG